MRKRAPDAVRLGAQRIAMHDECRDMQECALHVRHLHRKKIEINGRHMQTLLIVHPLLSQCLGQGNDHRTAADTGFVCANKFLLLYQMLRVMHEHLGHKLTHRIRREKLAALFVVNLQAVVESAKNVSVLVLQTQGQHAQYRRKLLELFWLVLRDDCEVLLLTCGFVDGIGHIAEGDGRKLDEMPKRGEEMLAVGELPDVCFAKKCAAIASKVGR